MNSVKIKPVKTEDKDDKPSRGFRIRKYVDPCTGLVFSKRKTYAENKLDYYAALREVCAGKYRTMFDAHRAYAT